MKNLRFLTLCLLLILAQRTFALANDSIFPPLPTAASFISFDGKGFVIDGHRTFIASGGMEYARVPRELWRDRLLRMKRAGLDCTEMYIFWNYHEPREGQWNFTGNHDLNAYLQLVHSLGMYAIVRIGPYVCAEWDSGGYPVWLRFKPGVVVRADNPQFLDETFKYYDKVVPIVAANQISHGGAVIMVQIENEDNDGWGTDSSLYEQKLRAKVLSLGIDVPTFFSGLHHASDPAGNTPWDDAQRTGPWFSTEFWTDWYDVYGPANPDPWTYSTWKIIAFGGNGYNYYMFHGGTNFGTYNNNEDASSYDYGAAVGQDGDLRPTYYTFKEAALFARTFQDILENSVSSTSSYSSIADNPLAVPYARTGPAGTIVFLSNSTDRPIETHVKGATKVSEPTDGSAIIPEHRMLPVVEGFQVTPNITIDESVTQILTKVTNGSNTTLVVYGPAGGNGAISLSSAGNLQLVSGTGWTQGDSSHGTLELSYPDTVPSSTILTSGGDRLQILSMSGRLADRTWPISTAKGTDLIVGPDYVGGSSLHRSKLSVEAEFVSSTVSAVLDYTSDLTATALNQSPGSDSLPAAPSLTGWMTKVVAEQQPQFDDSGWISAPNPPSMGADGDYGAYAWYRTIIPAGPAQTTYLIPSAVRDRMIVFLDGVRVPAAQMTPLGTELDLTARQHSLAILTAQYGRDKLYSYSGPINLIDAKGLTGPILLSDSPKVDLTDWESLPVSAIKPDLSVIPTSTDPGWQSVALGKDIFNGAPGWAWYQTVVPASESGTSAAGESVHFDSVDDNATVYCNGKLVGTHQGYSNPFDVDLSGAWIPGSANVITVLDENTGGTGGISGNIVLSNTTGAAVLTGWKMRGGVGDPDKIADWTPFSRSDAAAPAFYSAQFIDTPSQPGAGAHPILRIHLGGLSAGFVWLNGHNLGRYPEKIPVDGLWLPECWIKKGVNTVTIFDEDGKAPTGVKLYTETPASWYSYNFTQP